MILNILHIGDLRSAKHISVQNGLPGTPNAETLIADFQSDFSDNSFKLNEFFQEPFLYLNYILNLYYNSLILFKKFWVFTSPISVVISGIVCCFTL